MLYPLWAPFPFHLLISQPGIALPSFTCSFILQISNLSSLPLSDRYGAQMPHLPAPLVGMATTNPAFAHLTIYFPVSHFPVPHNGPKIPGKIKILSSLVATSLLYLLDSLTLSPLVSSNLKYVSYRQHMIASCFIFIQPDSLGPL